MTQFKRIVVKFGTSTLTAGGNRLSQPRILDLVRQVCELSDAGHELVLVSSGAVAAGKEVLRNHDTGQPIARKQMLAAIGQPRLMAYYEQYFDIFGKHTAQVLLTRADLADRRRYLNAKETLQALLANQVIPVINENDTVATEEIRVGDNDNLSAYTAGLVEADLLVLLTDQQGLYTADPRNDPDAQLIVEVPAQDYSPALLQAAGATQENGQGTGGMLTKLQAADIARRSGTAVRIAEGSQPDILLKMAAGECCGTFFPPLVSHLEARKRYLMTGSRARGAVALDKGAETALKKGGSLLPVGIRGVEGDFERGDTIRVLDAAGQLLGYGLANYSAAETRLVQGHRSGEMEALLGTVNAEEIVHRNNMVLMRGAHE